MVPRASETKLKGTHVAAVLLRLAAQPNICRVAFDVPPARQPVPVAAHCAVHARFSAPPTCMHSKYKKFNHSASQNRKTTTTQTPTNWAAVELGSFAAQPELRRRQRKQMRMWAADVTTHSVLTSANPHVRTAGPREHLAVLQLGGVARAAPTSSARTPGAGATAAVVPATAAWGLAPECRRRRQHVPQSRSQLHNVGVSHTPPQFRRHQTREPSPEPAHHAQRTASG